MCSRSPNLLARLRAFTLISLNSPVELFDCHSDVPWFATPVQSTDGGSGPGGLWKLSSYPIKAKADVWIVSGDTRDVFSTASLTASAPNACINRRLPCR
uniref:Putative secreted protein n=1 Tax=Ixodes ricinus TaxID=34613 RepID=A0A6B0U880_IXORI